MIESLDPVLLSRLQFAFTIVFHVIFPSFTIGLAAWIATLTGMSLFTGNDRYDRLARFWTKVFAVSFGMGVVSGIVLSYQFGLNWSRFSEVVGNVIGPLIGYEVLTAFFLEATFLGLMLFGWNRVPRWLHFFSCLMVAVGTCISAFWILSANSWMQHPVGHELRDGIAYPVDWLTIIFSPTFPTRFFHMVLAAFITTGFVVFATGARWWLQGKSVDLAETCIRMSLGLLIVLVPIQGYVGDASGEVIRQYQPVKLATIEGHWGGDEVPGAGVPLVVFAIPSEAEQKNLYQIAIPHLGSLIVTRSWDGTYPGLLTFPEADRPPLVLPFFGFRIMVGLWAVMLAAVLLGAWLWWRGRLFSEGLYLRAASWLWPIGFVTVISGWFVTEIGRQPWVATGILRTADAHSPLPSGAVLVTLILFVIVYLIVFVAGARYINHVLRRGPGVSESGADHSGGGEEEGYMRPISAAQPAGRGALQAGE